jgi:RNA polymerase sigma-70 factor (ECF subfamily)
VDVRKGLHTRPLAEPKNGPAAGSPEADAQELALVRAIQRGQTQAWSALLTRYQDRLFGVCYRMVGDRDMAADLTQDSMVKIIEGLSTYDGRSKLSTWMIRVTMNVCLSKMRSEKLRRHASLDAPERPGSGREARSAGDRLEDFRERELAGGSGVERDELRRVVAGALLRIAPEQRAILVLRDARDLDYDQIAEVLDIPVGTVKSRLFRARAALREAIESMAGRAAGEMFGSVDEV